MGESLKRESPATPVNNRVQVGVGLFVLFLGALVYVLDRSSGSAPFFSTVSMAHLLPSLFGRLGDNLPTFAHVFAFGLLTAACLGGGRRAGLLACLSWFGIDTAFEVGQHPWLAEQVVQFIPGWFERLPILQYAEAYFISGTFDVRDLMSIAAGAIAACLVNIYTTPRDIRHG